MAQNQFGYFNREVKRYPEPFVVLATDQQLLDLERFCTDDAEYYPMTVDPKSNTFNPPRGLQKSNHVASTANSLL